MAKVRRIGRIIEGDESDTSSGSLCDFSCASSTDVSSAESLRGNGRQSCSFKFGERGIEQSLHAAEEFDNAFGTSGAEARRFNRLLIDAGLIKGL